MSNLVFNHLGKLPFKTECLPLVIIPVCTAATGKKGTTKNKNQTGKNRKRGWKVQDGDLVHAGYCLAKQIHRYRWLPGANVNSGRGRTLTAACTGTVRFTKEVFIPNEERPLAKTVADFPRGALLYKTTINVIPDNEVGRFRLVENV